MTQPPRIASLCLICTTPLLSGCLSLGLVQSAQTLPRGEVHHQFGLEWFRVSSEEGGAEPFVLPFAMPFYGLRAGITDGVDLGFRTNVTFSNVGFDVKLQPLDTEHFDIAIDPTIQYAWQWGLAHLPLLIGLGITDRLQVVLSGRASYVFPLVDSSDPGALETVFGTSSQGMIGGGVGVYAQVSDRFALVPEVQVIRGFGETDPLTVSFTLGFTFGDQPDAEAEEEGERPPVTPTEPAYAPLQQQQTPAPVGPSGPATTPPGYGEP